MTTRISLVVAAALLGSPVLATAQTLLSRPASVDRLTTSSHEKPVTTASHPKETVLALLHKRVDNLDWIDVPLEEVISWLRDESEGQVNVVPRWSQLGRANVNSDTAVTIRLNNTTVAEVLNELVDQLSADGEVRYRSAGNKLIISTGADFNRKMVLRIYDVTDILFRVPDFGQDAPSIELQRAGSQGSGGQPVIRSPGSSSAGGEQVEQYIRTRLEELARKIQRVIAPETWDTPNTEGRGRIEVFGRSLWVYNTAEVHEQIAGRFSIGD
ncbi:MAG: hypothetical protein JSU86_01860 [Phycisphaerales bacterium]|nr:MAG: hypothetical protein JSU86_01860 [Phycisphaerales bacterium]